ncbi:MAG TPA: hypothetical protein VN493_29495 [Thermoanaerobaculia bacterium]|nr:hypothetical protein [Thermoanaerobaculia bacterium]
MIGPVAKDLLRGAGDLLDEVTAGRALLRGWLGLSLLMILSAAVYGGVLGMWHGPRLALYVAVKLPLVLLVTSALTVPFSWTGAAILGLPLRLGQVVVLTFLALAAGSLLLAALAPVALLFTLSAPAPGEGARTAHNLLYLLHTAFVGGCGLAGTAVLWRGMRALGPPARVVLFVWIAAFALVGGEVAWVLRPFVGSVYKPVVFLREDALDGNVYEFVFTDILPHLLGGSQPEEKAWKPNSTTRPAPEGEVASAPSTGS